MAKLFTPDANATCLLSEIAPTDHDCAFGLCDLGLGFTEWGYVSLPELGRVRGSLGQAAEREYHFIAARTISTYTEEGARGRAHRGLTRLHFSGGSGFGAGVDPWKLSRYIVGRC